MKEQVSSSTPSSATHIGVEGSSSRKSLFLVRVPGVLDSSKQDFVHGDQGFHALQMQPGHGLRLQGLLLFSTRFSMLLGHCVPPYLPWVQLRLRLRVPGPHVEEQALQVVHLDNLWF